MMFTVREKVLIGLNLSNLQLIIKRMLKRLAVQSKEDRPSRHVRSAVKTPASPELFYFITSVVLKYCLISCVYTLFT